MDFKEITNNARMNLNVLMYAPGTLLQACFTVYMRLSSVKMKISIVKDDAYQCDRWPLCSLSDTHKHWV